MRHADFLVLPIKTIGDTMAGVLLDSQGEGMKSHYLIYLLVFLCLMAGTRVDALTKEAQSAIEEMRGRLTQQAVIVSAVEGVSYIPGRDLALALQRLRQKVYGVDTPMVDTAVAMVTEKASAEDYIAGKELASALIKIRASQGRTEPLSIAMADIDRVMPSANAVKEEKAAIIPPVASAQTAAAEDKPVIEQSQPKAEEKTTKKAGKRSSGKKFKKQKKQKKSQPVQSEVVKKAVPAPAQADRTVAVTNDSDKPVEAKEKSVSAKGDDKAFNDSIKKYDFKMPENYRIIVR